MSITLIETKFIGGTGVDTAYTPTKTLVASASAHAAETAGLRKGSDRN
jgi:pyruvate/2-oxoglutarate dehydrogenase complex dihydrolipoamide dehydrogenase (E3) component